MYADEMTDSVKNSKEITDKRRFIQTAYNKKFNITPKTTERTLKEKKEDLKVKNISEIKRLPKDEIKLLIRDLEKDMHEAANDLDFEKAALLRDEIVQLKGML